MVKQKDGQANNFQLRQLSSNTGNKNSTSEEILVITDNTDSKILSRTIFVYGDGQELHLEKQLDYNTRNIYHKKDGEKRLLCTIIAKINLQGDKVETLINYAASQLLGKEFLTTFDLDLDS